MSERNGRHHFLTSTALPLRMLTPGTVRSMAITANAGGGHDSSPLESSSSAPPPPPAKRSTRLSGESSADEHTAIIRNGHEAEYGAIQRGTNTDSGAQARNRKSGGYGAAQPRSGDADADSASTAQLQEPNNNNRTSTSTSTSHDDHSNRDSGVQEHRSWWRTFVDKYGSVELDNKGSVARDHLALERTFLAWLRTSLSFASIGIGVTQLFRLNTSIQSGSGSDPGKADTTARLRSVGKPLGATFIGICEYMIASDDAVEVICRPTD